MGREGALDRHGNEGPRLEEAGWRLGTGIRRVEDAHSLRGGMEFGIEESRLYIKYQIPNDLTHGTIFILGDSDSRTSPATSCYFGV